MGNGYEAIYGQLQNVQVKTGDSVEAKTVLGYLAEQPDTTAWKDAISILNSVKTDSRLTHFSF